MDMVFVRPPPLSALSLAFPLLPLSACAALLLLPSSGRRQLRWVLDGAMVALAGLLLAWNTVLAPIIHQHGTVEVATGMLFPLADVALVTMAVLAGMYATRGRRRLRALAVALGWLSLGDFGYAYLSAIGRYHDGSFCDVCYIAAFLTLTAAARPLQDASSAGPQRRPFSPALIQALPYVAFGLSAAVVLVRRGFGHPLGFVELCMWSIMTALILLRQYLLLADNRRLLGAVEVQQEQLASMALTDPVTGLFNRVVFAERVGQALARHEREARSIALCWIDIDDFKVINDTYGHAAGDELLRRFSARIRETLRTEDTLARLGGDEFGVLLEDARCAIRRGAARARRRGRPVHRRRCPSAGAREHRHHGACPAGRLHPSLGIHQPRRHRHVRGQGARQELLRDVLPRHDHARDVRRRSA